MNINHAPHDDPGRSFHPEGTSLSTDTHTNNHHTTGANELPMEISFPNSTETPKPVRINVELDFHEYETGISSRRHTGLLHIPFRDMLEVATVRKIDQGENQRPMHKSIAVFQGITVKRVNGHMRYLGTVSVSPEQLDAVHANIHAGLQNMQQHFKGGLENVFVRFDPPIEAVITNTEHADVVLHHETSFGDDESRQGARIDGGPDSTHA